MSRSTWFLPTVAAVLAVCSFSASLLAADNTCQTLFDTRLKLFSVPTHSYTTETLPGGKSQTSEAIFTNGAIYVFMKGKWIHSRMTPQDMLKQEEENIRDSKSTCRHVRDEMVNGEAAALYMGHSENDGIKSDAQTWISKSKGLPLKTEEDIDTGDGDKRHMSIRYEYANVHPPAGVQ
ncbi:MAG: hypothetical protein WA637_01215 [Terriglobales bacterium]